MANINVLIVDDNLDLLESYRVALPVLDPVLHITTAADGITGLEETITRINQGGTGIPDVLIIDIMMPGLDGHQLVRALRGDPLTASMGIIILSAAEQDADMTMGLLEGADLYRVKPLAPADVVVAIHQVAAIRPAERIQWYLDQGVGIE